jgi:hypothetical protein
LRANLQNNFASEELMFHFDIFKNKIHRRMLRLLINCVRYPTSYSSQDHDASDSGFDLPLADITEDIRAKM